MYSVFNFSEEQEAAIRNFGALGYDPATMARILNVPSPDAFQREFDDPSSLVRHLYETGKDVSEYAIDNKLLELSMNGDLKALEKLEKRRAARAAVEPSGHTTGINVQNFNQFGNL
jgi:hypothetical protein